MSLTCDGRPAARTSRALVHSVLRVLDHHRFLRFLLVGGLNTAFGYGLFFISLLLLPTTFLALYASTVLAILFNFVTTGSYVFGSRDPSRLPLFFGGYAIIFAYNEAGLAVLTTRGIDPRLAGLLLLPGAIAASWLMNERLVFGRAA